MVWVNQSYGSCNILSVEKCNILLRFEKAKFEDKKNENMNFLVTSFLMFDIEISLALIFEDSIIDSLINNDCIVLMKKLVSLMA